MEVLPDLKANGISTEDDKELQKQYQDYLQKCCEVGQIEYQLEQLDGQRADIEKQLDVTRRSRNKSANAHRELQKNKLSKIKTAEAQKQEGQH